MFRKRLLRTQNPQKTPYRRCSVRDLIGSFCTGCMCVAQYGRIYGTVRTDCGGGTVPKPAERVQSPIAISKISYDDFAPEIAPVAQCDEVRSRRVAISQGPGVRREEIDRRILSPARMGLFSALAFLGTHKLDEFIKLMLFNLIIMAEPTERRSIRSRKPKVHFDNQIAQSLEPSKPSIASKVSIKTKPTVKPTTKPAASTKPFATEPSNLDLIQELCSQTEGLEITEKAKKKTKSEEIARLTKLGFHGILAEMKPLKEVEFEPFVPGDHREPKLNIPSNIDPTDPLALLDLFISVAIYATIAENTNLYTIVYNVPTSTTSQYWYPTNEHEIRVLFGILYYIDVHREPNYRIY
jgi:hypothetical protein